MALELLNLQQRRKNLKAQQGAESRLMGTYSQSLQGHANGILQHRQQLKEDLGKVGGMWLGVLSLVP